MNGTVNFRLLYRAKLKIQTKDGVKTFECPQKAMGCVNIGFSPHFNVR